MSKEEIRVILQAATAGAVILRWTFYVLAVVLVVIDVLLVV